MDVVVIYNGLSNQMSQYAFYLAKKQYNKDCLLIFDHKGKNNHNGSELDKLFGIRMSTGFFVYLQNFRISDQPRLRILKSFSASLL